jgi:hypothetical protein
MASETPEAPVDEYQGVNKKGKSDLMAESVEIRVISGGLSKS